MGTGSGMQAVLVTYFEGERNAGLILAGLGLAVLIGAFILVPVRWELRAFATTLLVCACIEILIGVGLYLKTPAQVSRLGAQLASDAPAFYAAETPRMECVQKTFVIIEVAWLLLILGSSVTAVWFKDRLTLNGFALGLLINVSALLAFDLIAERRGGIYLAALEAGAARGSGEAP